MTTPKSGEPYAFIVALTSRAGAGFEVNPTIAAGDFQVSIDGGAYANLTTLPVVSPAGSATVLISLSAAEMTGEKIAVLGVDQAGSEWVDMLAFIDAPQNNVDDVLDALWNDATTVVEGPGSRLITVFEDDGSTQKQQVRISADGLTRTKL